MELTKNEFRILKLLMENSGRIVSRENLITRLWESDEFIDDNTLTVNVARLRKKLEEIGEKIGFRRRKELGILWNDKAAGEFFERKKRRYLPVYWIHWCVLCHFQPEQLAS